MILCVVAALGLGIGSTDAQACSDRPGTPNEPQVEVKGKGEVYFSWRATHGRSEPELIMFYDINVWEQATGRPTRVMTGVPPFGAMEGPDFGDAVAVIGFPRYGERAGMYFNDLPLDVPQCFSVRARTQRGSEGCVSALASAPVCATPKRYRSLGKRR